VPGQVSLGWAAATGVALLVAVMVLLPSIRFG
jgi:hypothetical protein